MHRLLAAAVLLSAASAAYALPTCDVQGELMFRTYQLKQNGLPESVLLNRAIGRHDPFAHAKAAVIHQMFAGGINSPFAAEMAMTLRCQDTIQREAFLFQIENNDRV